METTAKDNRNIVIKIVIYIVVFFIFIASIKIFNNNLENKEGNGNKRRRNRKRNNFMMPEDTEISIIDDTCVSNDEDSDISIISDEADKSLDTSNDIFASIIAREELKNDNDIDITETKGRSKPEKICREIIEKIYKKPFPSVFPKFLQNPQTPRKLELDGYNEELKIAFEYNGPQHYKYIPHFHRKGISDFLYQLQKDDFKKRMCEEKGVYLILIPYTVPNDHLEEFIKFYLPENVNNRETLKRLGAVLPETWTPKIRNYN